MSNEEMKLLPYGFLKKYGSYIHFIKRMEQDAKVQENKQFNNYYEQVRHLKKL